MIKELIRFRKFVLLRFFHLIYNSLSFSYDFVSAIVSGGRWKEWIYEIIPYIDCHPILEIGHGPGHLLIRLVNDGHSAFGIDISKNMSKLARNNIEHAIQDRINHNHLPTVHCPCLIRGNGQFLPIRDNYFHYIVATFPAPYFFNIETLHELNRVLVPGGSLMILVNAGVSGHGILDKLIQLIYKICGYQNPPDDWFEQMKNAMEFCGFSEIRHEIKVKGSSTLDFIFARKN